MYDEKRLRSACAYAQSDQSLCSSLEYSITLRLLAEHHLEFLSLKGGCTGSSESTLLKMPHCWKSHVANQFCVMWFLELIALSSSEDSDEHVHLHTCAFAHAHQSLRYSFIQKLGCRWMLRWKYRPITLLISQQWRLKEALSICNMYQNIISWLILLWAERVMPNVFYNHYRLDESISNFRAVVWYISFLF